MGDATDPDDREEAWRFYEGAQLALGALRAIEPIPDSFFGRKVTAYVEASQRLEARWGFKPEDVAPL